MKYLKIILITIMLSLSVGITNAQTNNNTVSEDSTSQCVENEHYQTFTGKAAFYGTHYNSNRRTASGKWFNRNGLTAANNTLPFGTIVLVTNKKTGKSVKVEITDRGILKRGIIIDLSPRAFNSIANLSTGIIPVILKVISYPKNRK